MCLYLKEHFLHCKNTVLNKRLIRKKFCETSPRTVKCFYCHYAHFCRWRDDALRFRYFFFLSGRKRVSGPCFRLDAPRRSQTRSKAGKASMSKTVADKHRQYTSYKCVNNKCVVLVQLCKREIVIDGASERLNV